MDSHVMQTKFFRQATQGSFAIPFSRFDMFRDGAVQRQRVSVMLAPALLHQKPFLRSDQEDVNASMLQPMQMGSGTQLLANYQVGIIDNIE
jgi:hypothetical protein